MKSIPTGAKNIQYAGQALYRYMLRIGASYYLWDDSAQAFDLMRPTAEGMEFFHHITLEKLIEEA